jgi:transcriptional regulator with XRE-family HTH domain
MTKEQLRAMRLANGLTQESIADKLGLSPRHYKRLESGATPIRETLARLIMHELT